MKKALTILSGSLAAFALPLVASAAAATVNNLSDAGTWIINLINNVAVPLLFALAFVVFVYGVFETFILGRGSEEKRKEGGNLILWGIIGFVVMLSVWGLVNVLTGSITFGTSTITPPKASALPAGS